MQTGLIIKYSQRQFYSAEQNRLINIYILSTPALGRDRHGEWKEKDLELIRTTSQLEIVNCPERYMGRGEAIMYEELSELKK